MERSESELSRRRQLMSVTEEERGREMRSSPAPLHSHAPSLSPSLPPSLANARSLAHPPRLRLGLSPKASERARASFHFASAPKGTTVELGRLPFHVVTVVESAFNGHDSASEEPSLHPWGSRSCQTRWKVGLPHLWIASMSVG